MKTPSKSYQVLIFAVFFSYASLGQPSPCKKVEEGVFEVLVDGSPTVRIIRKGNIRRDSNLQYGIVTEAEIEWIDDCTYKLGPHKVIENKFQAEIWEDFGMMVEILSVGDSTYVERITAELLPGDTTIVVMKIVSLTPPE